MKSLGARVRGIRKQNNLTQKEFAEKVCVSPSYISKVESDKEIPAEMFVRLLSLQFKVSYHWLLDNTGNMTDFIELDEPVNQVDIFEKSFRNLKNSIGKLYSERDGYNLLDMIDNITQILSLEMKTAAQKSVILEIFRDVISLTAFTIQTYTKLNSKNPDALDELINDYFAICKKDILGLKDVFLLNE